LGKEVAEEMSTRMPDAVRLTALMVSYQAGHFGAFDEIYALVSPVVRRYHMSHARDAAKAEDLVQDTFLQLHRARHTFDPAYPLLPWVMAIARHCWLMDRRRASRRPRFSDDVALHEPMVRADAEALADRLDVRRALGQVVASRRRAVVAHHVFGLSFREIARRTGVAETAAKLRSSRGVAQLRVLLGPRRRPPLPGDHQ
jgi:RNA polymerase sigma-70 factor (ECF subfamily)